MQANGAREQDQVEQEPAAVELEPVQNDGEGEIEGPAQDGERGDAETARNSSAAFWYSSSETQD